MTINIKKAALTIVAGISLCRATGQSIPLDSAVRTGKLANAYTSFDETVYELPIPTDDPSMTANGLRIMRDWAQEALLDSIEIEKERGVVLEEERLGKGAKDRMS